MADIASNPTTVLLSQMRTLLDLVGRKRRLTDEENLQFRICVAMLESWAGHRPKPDFSAEQALEMTTILNQFHAAALDLGVPETPLKDLMAQADRLLKLPAGNPN